jgi:peptidoglycan/LPS O-acetylase OafA/YrhL
VASRFRLDIEGLRAVAVLLVVANHAWHWPTGGYVGVDIFFVISGYLITRALLREKEKTGGIALGRFYTRRFARLAPAAVATIAVSAVASNLLFFGVTNATWNQQAFASLVWVQNWFLVQAGTVYLNTSGSVSPYQHFWSLSVEEQFYAFWPWLLILAWVAVAALARGRAPRLRQTVLALGLVGLAASLAFSVWFTASRPASAYFATPTRIWEFAVGVIIATGFLHVTRHWSRVALRTAGLVAIAISAVLFDATTPFPGAAALLPVLGTGAIIVAAERATSDRDFGRVLTLPPVRYVGRISYSLYLWHAPILVFAAALFRAEGFVHGLLCALISLIVAAASYRFIEDPARHARVWKSVQAWLSRRQTWSRVGGFAVTAALVALLSVQQLRGPVLPPPPAPASAASAMKMWASIDQVSAALETAVTSTSWASFEKELSAPLIGVDYRGCLRDAVGLTPSSVAGPNATCLPRNDGGSHTAIVVGDSIALSWVPAIEGALGPGWKVGALGLQGCPAASAPVREVRDRGSFVEDCARARSADLATIAAARPDLIVMSSGIGSVRFLDSGSTGAAAALEWRQATLRSIESVRSAGAPVVVLGNPPEGMRPADCAVTVAGPDRCVAAMSPDTLTKRDAEQRAVADAVARGMTAAYVDPDAWFCTPDGSCPVGAGGRLIRVDTSHLTAAYSASLGALMRSALVTAGVVPAKDVE